MPIDAEELFTLKPLVDGSESDSSSTWPCDPAPPHNSNSADPLVVSLIVIACVPIIVILVAGVVLLLVLCLAVCVGVFLTVALAFASALPAAAQD